MQSTSSHPAKASPLNLHHWKERAEEYIRQKPARAAVQAALVGYTLQFFPLRTALAAAARLAIPGIFAAGLYKVVESFRQEAPKS